MIETKNGQKKAQGRVLLLSAALCWGLAGVCVKSVVWGSFSLLAARSVLSLLILLLFKRSFCVRLSKTNLLGGAMVAMTGILYVVAIKLTTAGTAIVLQYIAPILVYLYGVIFQKKPVRFLEMLIVAAVFFGCVLSFSDQWDASHILGNGLALLSGVFFAAEIVITNREDSCADDALIISNLLSLLVCFPLACFDKNLVFDAKNLIWVLILGVFQYGLANVCFSRGIQKVDALEGSLILTVEPIFNPIPVWIFCGETMGSRAIIGAVIVIVFVALYGAMSKTSEKKEMMG